MEITQMLNTMLTSHLYSVEEVSPLGKTIQEVQKRHQTFDTLNQKLYLCRKNEHYLFFLFLMVLTIFY